MRSKKESEALASLEEAFQLCVDLANEDPLAFIDAAVERLIMLLNARYVNLGNPQRTLKFNQQLVSLWYAVVDAKPNDVHAQHLLARAHEGLGLASAEMNIDEKAAESFEAALRILRPLVQADSENSSLERSLDRVTEHLDSLSSLATN